MWVRVRKIPPVRYRLVDGGPHRVWCALGPANPAAPADGSPAERCASTPPRVWPETWLARHDSENLFRPGRAFLVGRNGGEMREVPEMIR
jgi:hypothetical protein